MSLHVRLRHSLGERLLELPDRPVDEPVVVGRWSGADVQVPSVAVAQRHCVLFVHEGRWAIQPTGPAGTFVNGVKAEGPAFLHVGDVVTLGAEPNASTIEIDPIGAAQGRTGQPAGTLSRPAVPPPVPAQPAYPSEAAYSETADSQSVPGDAGPGEDVGHAAGDIVSWPAASGSTPAYYPRRRRQDSSAAMTFGVLLCLGIIGGVGFFVYHRRQEQAQIAQQSAIARTGQKAPAPAGRREEETSQVPESIFDKGGPRPPRGPVTRPGSTRPGATAPATRPGGGESSPVDSTDAPTIGVVEPIPQDATDATTQPGPGADDPAWKQVQAARFSQGAAKAILKFDEYAHANPDRFSPQITEYTEKAMDRLWFERLEQLCKQREELNRNLQQTDKEMVEETDAAYKKRVLVPLKEKYASRLQTLEEELKKEMKYEAAVAPNLLDDAQVEKLRRQRDPEQYKAWKNHVLSYIRRSHGELPWASS